MNSVIEKEKKLNLALAKLKNLNLKIQLCYQRHISIKNGINYQI